MKGKPQIAVTDSSRLCNSMLRFFQFNGLIEVDNIFPEPDIITSHQIIYRDNEKISQLYKDNIQCLISLPQNETLQQVRIYIISAFITLFLHYYVK